MSGCFLAVFFVWFTTRLLNIGSLKKRTNSREKLAFLFIIASSIIVIFGLLEFRGQSLRTFIVLIFGPPGASFFIYRFVKELITGKAYIIYSQSD